MRPALTVIVAAVLVVAGAVLGWNAKPTPDPVYERVEVPVGAMIKLEPKFDLSFLEQLYKKSLTPTQRAVATGGAKEELDRFCAPVVRAAADSVDVPDLPAFEAETVLKSYRLTDPWNPWGERKVEHFGMNNRGDRFHDQFNAPASGTIEGGAVGDSTVVVVSRAGWLQPTVTHAVAGGLGYLLGSAIKAATSD